MSAAYPGSEFDDVWKRLTFPDDHVNPKPESRYHVVVIGAGSAGLISAIGAAGLGARVALVERDAMGGDCLNIGCVPSKALLEYTRQHPSPVSFDDAFRWLRRVRSEISAHDSVERYTKNGVDVFLGNARLEDDRTVVVGNSHLSARRIVIATGARASLPPIPGLDDVIPLTNETLFNLKAPPSSLAILGAGAIGCEMAQAFSRLGVDVHLFEMADRVLPLEEEEASAAIESALTQAGTTVYLNSAVTRASRNADNVTLQTSELEVAADEVLVATGRRANIEDLGLEAAGVVVEDGLIKVDSKMRTSNRRIFAAGDVCSRTQFTHNADAQARIVVQNALFAPTASTKKLVVPHCTYTKPEVAHVGRSRRDLAAESTEFDVYRIDLGELDRSRTSGDADGYVEVLTRSGHDEILGATIVAQDAGEQIAGLCLAIAHGIGLSGLGKALLPYPTRAEYLRRLADAYNRTRLTDLTKRLMSGWFRWSA